MTGATSRCLTDADVAERFGVTRDWVYRNIARLIAEDSFPAPLSTVGRRRYSRRRVDAWFEGDRDHHKAAPPPLVPEAPDEEPEEDALDEWKAALARRYAAR